MTFTCQGAFPDKALLTTAVPWLLFITWKNNVSPSPAFPLYLNEHLFSYYFSFGSTSASTKPLSQSILENTDSKGLVPSVQTERAEESMTTSQPSFSPPPLLPPLSRTDYGLLTSAQGTRSKLNNSHLALPHVVSKSQQEHLPLLLSQDPEWWFFWRVIANFRLFYHPPGLIMILIFVWIYWILCGRNVDNQRLFQKFGHLF